MLEQECSVIVEPINVREQYCIFEHLMVMEPGQPPVVIYVNICKLIEVFKLTISRQNSEWVRLTSINPKIMVRIVATGEDRQEMMRNAMKHARSFNPMPICNLRGFKIRGGNGIIKCSNGMEYRTQMEASTATGCSQSAISKCLRGDIAQVGGLVFTYGD